MAWLRWVEYPVDSKPIRAWNMSESEISVLFDLSKYDGTRLPLISDGDVMRLCPVSTDRAFSSFVLVARDVNGTPIIDGIQLKVGLAFPEREGEEGTGEFPVATEDPFRYEEFFCTVNQASNASPYGRVDVTGSTMAQPVSMLMNSPRRSSGSIRDVWRRTGSTRELDVPGTLDLTVTFSAIGTNPATGVILCFNAVAPRRILQLSDTASASVLLDN